MNRRVLAIGAGAAAVILLVWYFVLWKPRADDLDKAKDRRASAEASAAQLQTEIDRLRADQRQEPLRRAQLERVRTLIPDEPNLAQFILDANDAAVRAGIDFISISPALPAAGTGGAAAPGAPAAPAGAAPPEIKLAFQISGGYFQVLDFVNRLDALPRLVVTDGLTLSADPSARMTVAVTARMFTHVLPPGFGTTPTSAPGGATTTTTTPGAAASATTTTTTAAPGSAAGVATTSTTTTPAGGTQ
ncbi:MAG TPA: type II secretion system protein GspM [Acidimicrobiales bacterium]|nr:type II secretion system protein GspM [Acidimicrobiales bacterium]